MEDGRELRMRKHNFEKITESHRCNKRQDDGFEQPHASALQEKDEQHIERGDKHSRKKRNMKQQVECDGAAQYFSKIACDDSYFRNDPEKDRRRFRESLAAQLRQIAASHDAQPARKNLKQNRNEIAREDDPEQIIMEP